MSNWIANYGDFWSSSDNTLYSSDTETDCPKENALTRSLTDTCCLSDLTDAYLKITGTDIYLYGIYIFGCNFTSGATIKIQGSDDNFATPAAYDQELDLDTTRGTGCHIPSAPVDYDAWRLLCTDAANPDGYQEIGRIFMGYSWEPTWGYNEKSTDMDVDTGKRIRFQGGKTFSVYQQQYRAWKLFFDHVDGTGLRAFKANVGTTREWVMLKRPWGYITDDTYPNPEENCHYVSCKKFSENRYIADAYKMNLEIEQEL